MQDIIIMNLDRFLQLFMNVPSILGYDILEKFCLHIIFKCRDREYRLVACQIDNCHTQTPSKELTVDDVMEVLIENAPN